MPRRHESPARCHRVRQGRLWRRGCDFIWAELTAQPHHQGLSQWHGQATRITHKICLQPPCHGFTQKNPKPHFRNCSLPQNGVMEKLLSLWCCFKIQTAGAASQHSSRRGCLLQGRLDLGKPISPPIPPSCPPPSPGFGSAPCAQGCPSSDVFGQPRHQPSWGWAGGFGARARRKLSPKQLWSLHKTLAAATGMELLQRMQRKDMGAGSQGRVSCPSWPPVSGDMGKPEERGRTGLVLPPSLWALHPKGLIQLCVLQGASLHLTGALTWLKQLVCSHPLSSASPFLAPPARRGVSKGSLAQDCGPHTRSSQLARTNASSCPCPRERLTPSGVSFQPRLLMSPREGCWPQLPKG